MSPRPTIRRYLALCAAAVVAFGLAGLHAMTTAEPAQAYTTTGCKWPGGVTVRANQTATYQTALTGGVAMWNATDAVVSWSASSGSITTQVAHYGNNGYEGYASWTCSGATTTGCHAYVNTYYTSSFSTNFTRLRVLWTHELGHCLGLGHSGGTNAIMYTAPSSAYFAGRTTLGPDDLAGINSIY